MDKGNSIVKLKQYLGTPGNLVSMDEFKEFWDSLSEEEKEEYKTTELE